MEEITDFKPQLIPNFKAEKDLDAKIATIETNWIGDITEYEALPKKDGCRGETVDGDLHSRSFVNKKDSSEGLKLVANLALRKKYKALAMKCQQLGIILEGEIFSPQMRFNEILRFFKTADVTDPKHTKKLSKVDLDKEFYGRSIEWLTTNHDDLKLYLFDCVVLNEMSLPTSARLAKIQYLFAAGGELHEFNDIVSLPVVHPVDSIEDLKRMYKEFLEEGYEGLVLVHKDSPYKQGRVTLKEGYMYKLKDDCKEYDAQIIRVEESMVSIGETSTLQENREPSGMAKGFVVGYKGHEFTVQLKDRSHEQRTEIWNNKESYVGQWITYKGMEPVKNVPRHAFLLRMRDDK